MKDILLVEPAYHNPYPLRFRSLNSANGQYVSINWDSRLLRGLQLSLMFYYIKGIIRKNREVFKNVYGNNAKKFKHKLYETYENDKLRKL